MNGYGQDLPSWGAAIPTAIAVRAYVQKADKKSGKQWQPQRRESGSIEPSSRVLIFDTETSIDAAQCLRFGTYQLRNGCDLEEAGIFFDPATLPYKEQAIVHAYGKEQNLKVLTAAEFVETVFYGIAYELGAIIVGFNLPFDLSRLARGHSAAKSKSMRGGFTFRLADNPLWPYVQIKHLTRTASIIRFAKPARRERRRDGLIVPASRGYFVDVRTLAAALTNRSFSLASLAGFLGTRHRKLDTEEHGGPLTAEYLDYAARDVQVTWECFDELRKRYAALKLTKTPMHHIYSVAGIGKASLKEMGLRPWREMQPDFPPEILGNIMSTYHGGRSEVHRRREITQVLYCDFRSMYPTVCTLMHLWDFVIAKRMKWREATADVRAFLERVTFADLQEPNVWPRLCAIVRIERDRDILPIRAKYGHETHYTTGVNCATGRQGWYTLADCIASKLRTGKPPQVIRALTFEPGEMQDGLVPIAIAGNADYRIDPRREDFYRRGIDLRNEIKARMERAMASELPTLDVMQEFLKILINATSYGIFLELNVEGLSKLEPMRCFGSDGKDFLIELDTFEEPGTYFHPLLGTLITGAARLMLAITECLVTNAGLDWAFCDTDSMAIAKPEAMEWPTFVERVHSIQSWLGPLNPYAANEPLLKIEKVNYRIVQGRRTNELWPLYCLAISAKRYALFNVEHGRCIVIRDAKAHGLGHLRPPYSEEEAPSDVPRPVVPLQEIGIERWQHDLWYRIVETALKGSLYHPDYCGLPNFERPAVIRYAATSPRLLRVFRHYNRGKPYHQQVRPFNFLLMFCVDPLTGWEAIDGTSRNGKGSVHGSKRQPRAVAPFHREAALAAQQAFDRDTGSPVAVARLKTFRRVLAYYHLHPESKFENGDYTDHGATVRRHVEVTAVDHIGKEAHRWEEQFFLGRDPDARLEYGISRNEYLELESKLRQMARTHGVTAIARAAGVSRQHIAAILSDATNPTAELLFRLCGAGAILEAHARAYEADATLVLSQVKDCCRQTGLRSFARIAEVDAGHLARMLRGERKPPSAMLARLQRALAATQVEMRR